MRVISKDPTVLSDNIRFLRRRRKLSREKFAEYIEIGLNQLFCIENGTVDYIHFKALNNLAEIYGIPAEEILSENLAEKYAGKQFHYSR